MYQILNVKIAVHDCRIEDSKFEGKGKCLWMQISIDDVKHVVFTGSKPLIDSISQIPRDTGFPFTTTIVMENGRYEFT